MMKNNLTLLKKRIEKTLRSELEKLTPENRTVVVLVLLTLFGALAIYMTVSSMYNIGKGGRKMSIERIERPPLQQRTDSIKPLNKFDYD
ncbi:MULTISPECIES: TraL conjugative transposon family protein [Bacteroidales]|uniref:TraL conjugative transposon family protein n=1 Tax=Bacteroidales TaxID=171549 RepID=UPI00359F4086